MEQELEQLQEKILKLEEENESLKILLEELISDIRYYIDKAEKEL